jgi:hypothetical protein
MPLLTYVLTCEAHHFFVSLFHFFHEGLIHELKLTCGRVSALYENQLMTRFAACCDSLSELDRRLQLQRG